MGHRYDTATHSREGEGGGGDSRDKNPAFHASVSLGQMSGCGRLVWEWGGGGAGSQAESQYKVSC